jgi:acyl-CoA thioester hydrolase
MGALSSPRALEWFEVGRTEWLRASGLSYSQMETQGLFLPVVEAHCRYRRRVRFDEPIRLRTCLSQVGRASLRFEYEAVLDASQEAPEVLAGWTSHAFVGPTGQMIRPPGEILRLLQNLVAQLASRTC